MSNRHDDELIRLAFGDLEGPDAEAMRRQVEEDPTTALQFSQLCAIKEDLATLRKVPEMQLGKERLRARLLDGGLAPRRFNPLNWAWLPASFALAFVAFLSVRPGTDAPRPSLVAETGTTIALDFTKFDHAELTRRVFHPVDDIALEMSDLQEGVQSAPRRVTFRRVSPRVRSPRPVAPTDTRSSAASTSDSASAATMAAPGSTPSFEEAPAPDRGGDSVVFIGSERDRGTGAQIAREDNQNADVLFGG